MRLLVTGASGFLGRHVVDRAIRSGHLVRAVVRPSTCIEHLCWPDSVEVFRADLRGGSDLRPAFDDVDALVHLAAGMSGTDEQRFQATVAGTERILDAMAASHTGRLVLASSFYVYDWKRASRQLTEDAPVLDSPYCRDGYTVAKVWQERVARKKAAQHCWDLITLRPGFIWGRGSELPPRIGVQCGRLLGVVGPLSDAALTHVENCAGYFVRAAERLDLTDRTLNVFDGHRVRAWRYARAYQKCTGASSWRVPIPYGVGYATASLAKMTSRLLFGPQGRLPSLLTPLLYQARFRPLRFSTEALVGALGEPEYDFEECLRRTFTTDTLLPADGGKDAGRTPVEQTSDPLSAQPDLTDTETPYPVLATLGRKP